MANLNYVAILASGVAATIIGTIWYVFLFKKAWREGHAFSDAKAAELEKSMPVSAGISFVGYLVTAYILCLLLSYMNITDMQSALRVTFLIWLGFPAMTGLLNTLYAGRSLVVYIIDVGYQLAYMLVTAMLLMVLR